MRNGSLLCRHLIAFAGLCCASAAAAGPVPLDGDGLKNLVPGTLIELDTPLNTVIPIRFTADGMMTGEARSLASYLGAERDRGRWHISGDKLCLKWFRWFDAEERCLTLQQEDQRIHWQEVDGKSGTATIIERTEIASAKPAPAPPAAKAPAPVIASATPSPALPAPVVAAATANTSKPDPFAGITIISRAEAATSQPASEAPPAAVALDGPETAPAEPIKTAQPVKPAKQAPAKIAAVKPPAAKKASPAKVSSLVLTKEQAGKRAALGSEPTYQVANVEDDDVLNIRNGPSEYHVAVGAIPPSGRGVKIVGNCKAEWCPITHGHARGWVNRYYLSQESPVEAARRIR